MIKKQKITAIIILAFSIVGSSFAAHPEKIDDFESRLTLHKVIKHTYNYNDDLKAAAENSKKGSTMVAESLTNFLPRASFTYRKSKKFQDDLYSSNPLDPSSPQVLERPASNARSSAFQVTQSVFNSGGDFLKYKNALKKKASSDTEFRLKEQEILLETIISFINVITSKKHLELYNQKVEKYKKYLESTREKKAFDEATKTEVAFSLSSLDKAITESLSRMGEYEAAKAKFENITGLKAENLVEPNIEDYSEPFDLDILKQQALFYNLELNNSKYKLESANYEIAEKMTDFLPSADLSYTQSRQTKSEAFYEPSKAKDKTIALVVNVPIFQRGVEYTNLKSSKREYNRRRFSHNSLTKSILEKTTTGYYNHKIAISMVTSTASTGNSAKVAFESVQEESEQGVKEADALLDAGDKFFEAQYEADKAIANLVKAYYEVKFLTGSLSFESFM